MEGIDFDENAEIAVSGESRQTYQPDFPNILDGLRSPLQLQSDSQHDCHNLSPNQEPTEWRLNDTLGDEGLEGATETFPDLLQGQEYPNRIPNLDQNIDDPFPFSPFNDEFQSAPISSCPSIVHQWPPFHEADQTLNLAPEQNNGQPLALNPRVSHPMSGGISLPIRSIDTRTIDFKPLSVSKRPRRSSTNDGKKSVPLTRVGSNSQRGIRSGKIPPPQAEKIAQKRGNKSVCIGCKSARVTVSDPCKVPSRSFELTDSSALLVLSTQCHATIARERM